MTELEMKARIAELEKLVINQTAKGTAIKISAKGGVSFYGLGRWPVTLYASQWRTLAANIDRILAFVNTNETLLASKPEKETSDESTSV